MDLAKAGVHERHDLLDWADGLHARQGGHGGRLGGGQRQRDAVEGHVVVVLRRRARGDVGEARLELGLAVGKQGTIGGGGRRGEIETRASRGIGPGVIRRRGGRGGQMLGERGSASCTMYRSRFAAAPSPSPSTGGAANRPAGAAAIAAAGARGGGVRVDPNKIDTHIVGTAHGRHAFSTLIHRLLSCALCCGIKSSDDSIGARRRRAGPRGKRRRVPIVTRC